MGWAQRPLSMPRFFSDGMVLQRDVKIPVWGWGEPGSRLVVGLNGKTVKTTVGADGSWKVYLPKMKAGGPYLLKVEQIPSPQPSIPSSQPFPRDGKGILEVKNVLVGDVFLCSGQSNMELPIRRCMDKVADEVKDYSNDQIRYLKFPHQYNYVRPNDDVRILPWQNITPQNCSEVGAICYFMARELQESIGVPIGIINSSVGGTQVQAWMPREVLATFKGYPEELAKQKYHQQNWPDSINRVEMKAFADWERTMMATDTVLNRWRAADYDFGRWQTVDVFSDWSHGRNGSYWFETTVTLPRELAAERAVLRFGAMKDADSIFVNGTFVGNTTYEYPPRIYQVKEGVLREGENRIVVHLMSQSGRANFTKGKLYQLEVGGQVFPLSTQMHMAVGCTMPRRPSSTYFVDTPTGLYNAMIAPLQDFPVKGMLWYQGESNQGNPGTYADMLTAMVGAWRKQFGRNFPAVIVQLPAYMGTHDQPVETGWTKIRHQQYLAAQQIEGAGLVPTLDTGEFNDIHPQDKNLAGRRVAQQMRRLAYGDKGVDCDVPKPVSARVAEGKVIITFGEVGSGLTVKGERLKDFAILVGGKYQWAEATLTDGHTVAVSLPDGVTATTVRYGWDDYPYPSLFNKEGVPVPQFQIETK